MIGCTFPLCNLTRSITIPDVHSADIELISPDVLHTNKALDTQYASHYIISSILDGALGDFDTLGAVAMLPAVKGAADLVRVDVVDLCEDHGQ